MPRYDVVFADQTHPLAAMILEAASPGDARKPLGRRTPELWCDGRMLGRLERTEGEEGSYWRVG